MMFKMKFTIFLLYLSFCVINALNIGDTCIFYDDARQESIEGVCEETKKCEEVLKTIDDGKRTIGPVCHYTAEIQGSCCPTKESNPDKDCTTLPPEPSFPTPAHKVAWTKCIQNEKQVTCKKEKPKNIFDGVCKLKFNYSFRPVPTLAEPGEFPHIASLGYKDDSPSGVAWLATGSLINEKFILTTASALTYETFGSISFALLGAIIKADAKTGKQFSVCRSKAHKHYNSVTKENDIGLVELDKPVTFSDMIRPICLPVAGIEFGDIRHVCGWKAQREFDVIRPLMRRYFREMNTSVCAKELRSGDFKFNKKNMVCASGVINDTKSTQSEPGASLLSEVLNDEFSCNYVINGILSWGESCGNSPVVYTRVSAFVDWIVQNAWPEAYEEIGN